MKRSRFVVLLLVLSAITLAGQDSGQNLHPRTPTVTFDCYWEAARPQEYIITVQAVGKTSYLSRNPVVLTQSSTPQLPDYQIEFTMSSVDSGKIFKMAERANYFQGNFDYKKHAMANTGKKTLTYSDLSRHSQTVYNYSENKAIQGLTRIFQNISTTLEHGRKLAFMHKYDKLGIDTELKAAEEEAQNHQLAEVQVIAPVLQSIADDPTVLNMARRRAARILKLSK